MKNKSEYLCKYLMVSAGVFGMLRVSKEVYINLLWLSTAVKISDAKAAQLLQSRKMVAANIGVYQRGRKSVFCCQRAQVEHRLLA